MTISLTFPAQTVSGIEDPMTFFKLCHDVKRLVSLLQQSVEQCGNQRGFVKQLNCEVLTRVVARVLPDQYGVVVVDGYFGTMGRGETGLVQYEHSWLVAPCAPAWVIDVVPFNGFMTPSIVLAAIFPWLGLYRPEAEPRSLMPTREAVVVQVAAFLKALAEYKE